MEQSKTERDRRRVELELRRIAFANAADYVEILEVPENGRQVRILPTCKMNAGRRAAVAAVKEGKNGVELKLKDTLKALELLCRLNGLIAGEKKAQGGGDLGELLEGLKELEQPPDSGEDEDDL